jgi:hypothetical protein
MGTEGEAPRFCGRCGAEQVPHIKIGPGHYRAVARATVMELEGGMANNCPECARLLQEVCRLSFELGKADGRHVMLRLAAHSLLERADAAGPMPALAASLDALQEALDAIERADPTAELPPRP